MRIYMDTLKLGYWKTRSLAEAIRMMLEYLNVPYENILYEQGDGPEYSREEWYNARPTLGMEFPNLPYLVDGDFKLSESTAILIYLAEKYDPSLLGTSLANRATASMVYEMVFDLKSEVVNPCYSPDYATLIGPALDKIKSRLEKLATFLTGKQFVLGSELTYADFFLYETLNYLDALSPGLLGSVSPVFSSFQISFQSLPRLQEYLSKPRLPYNNKVAAFK